MKLYLAGPDVFLADAMDVGARKRGLCRKYGFEGLFPVDPEKGESKDPAVIFRANCALMQEADGGLFNLTPFRGPSADVGTAFELGFLFARGTPIHGYASRGGAYADRVEKICGRVLIIHEGKLVETGTPDQIAQRLMRTGRVRMEIRGDGRVIKEALEKVEHVERILWSSKEGMNSYIIDVAGGNDIRPELFRCCAANNWEVYELSYERLSLEEAFTILTSVQGQATSEAGA